MQVNLNLKLALEKLDLHLLLIMERPEAVDEGTNLPALLFSCPLNSNANGQSVKFSHPSRTNHYFLIHSNPISTQYLYNLRQKKSNQACPVVDVAES